MKRGADQQDQNANSNSSKRRRIETHVDTNTLPNLEIDIDKHSGINILPNEVLK